MTSALSFRAAQEDDLPRLHRLYGELDAGECADLGRLRNTFATILRQPGVTVWIAESAGEFVGSFILAIVPALGARCRPVALVEDVVVDPARQREGIGRRMMEFALEEAKESGAYKLMLSSNLRREEAHRFYDALGFERHGYSFQVQL
jgi:GNAT superfamily N-acetyltransferase